MRQILWEDTILFYFFNTEVVDKRKLKRKLY